MLASARRSWCSAHRTPRTRSLRRPGRGQAGVADEHGPAVSLGSGGNRLVLGGELGVRTLMLLLGSDGLVYRQLSLCVLQSPVEHRACGDVVIVAQMRFGLLVDPIEDHVGVVGVLTVGHRDVEVLACRGRFHRHVRGIDRDLLHPMRRDRVTRINIVGYVAGRKPDGTSEPASSRTDDD